MAIVHVNGAPVDIGNEKLNLIQAALKGGIPPSVSAVTINKVCGSGLKSVMLASQAIKAGDLQVAVAGGQESMSNAPYYMYGLRNGVKASVHATRNSFALLLRTCQRTNSQSVR